MQPAEPAPELELQLEAKYNSSTEPEVLFFAVHIGVAVVVARPTDTGRNCHVVGHLYNRVGRNTGVNVSAVCESAAIVGVANISREIDKSPVFVDEPFCDRSFVRETAFNSRSAISVVIVESGVRRNIEVTEQIGCVIGDLYHYFAFIFGVAAGVGVSKISDIKSDIFNGVSNSGIKIVFAEAIIYAIKSPILRVGGKSASQVVSEVYHRIYAVASLSFAAEDVFRFISHRCGSRKVFKRF